MLNRTHSYLSPPGLFESPLSLTAPYATVELSLIPMKHSKLVSRANPGGGNGNPLRSAPVFLPGKSHGQRILAGYSPWGRQESETSEHARTHARSRAKSGQRAENSIPFGFKKKKSSQAWCQLKLARPENQSGA